MAKKKAVVGLSAAKAALEAAGYRVNPHYHYVKRTFHLDRTVLETFLSCVKRVKGKSRGSIAEAATEALALWVERAKR